MSDIRTTIGNLIALQDADLKVIRGRKRLEDLPEREKILSVRSKLAELETQSATVAEMRQKCDASLKRLQDEDATQAEKAETLESKIKDCSDYRIVTSLTRDLEGVAKRREKIGFETNGVLEKSEKISTVEKQLADAQAVLTDQEAKLVESFKANGMALQKEIAQGQMAQEKLRPLIPADLLARYDKAAKARGGIALAQLKGNHCGACRAELHEGQIAKVKAAAPFSECPSCHRILLVVDEGEGE